MNFTLVFLTSSLWSTTTVAQSEQPMFDREKCLQELAKQGLKPNEASVWCNYQEECLVQSQQEGLPLVSAQTVCQCSISEFRNKYTSEKFKELTGQVDSNRKVARELREVGEKCFEEILFE